jgi:hypothetical protein
MLYHLKGLNPQGDVYRPERVFRKAYRTASEAEKLLLRDLVKSATLICLNVNSRTKAEGSLFKILKEHKQSKLLWQFVRVERPKTKHKGIIQRIVDAHSDKADKWMFFGKPKYGIADKFFSGDGLTLMAIESRMMHLMLKLFTRAKKPALMIHDAVVCRQQDLLFTSRVMDYAWRRMVGTGYQPVIKREF